MQSAAVRLTVHIKLSGPHAAIAILSFLSEFDTTSLIKAFTSGRPCAASKEEVDSHGLTRLAVSTSISKVGLGEGKCFFSSSMGEVRVDGTSVSLSFGGDELGVGRVVWRKRLTRGLAWSSASSERNQERFSS